MAEGERRWTRQEVGARGGDASRTVFVVDNVVYDVTPFLDEHPGGHEVLQGVAGRDASEDFADVGHSLDAKELMRKWRVGEVVEGERTEVTRRQVAWDDSKGDEEAGFLGSWKMPVLLGALATVLYCYLFG